MPRRRNKYALCINNAGYKASLELRKIYRVLPPHPNGPDGWLRVIDESGEDYLYSGKRFVLITLPREVERVLEPTF